MKDYSLFISDLHLREDLPNITHAFLQLLKNEAIEADALYILGDFFDSWIGDDNITRFTELISHELKALSAHTSIYFIHGNRDFLLGQHFAEKAGLQLLPDFYPLNLYGQSIILTHGDSLCTLDIGHQRFRKFALNPFYQKLFLKLPLSFRRFVANTMRNKSLKKSLAPAIMDVTDTAVEKLMTTYHADILIHGHTHQQGMHCLNERPLKRRMVLGAWHQYTSVLRFNRAGLFDFISTPIID